MRWKAMAFLGKLEASSNEKYGFKTRYCPPQIEELSKFEIDMMHMVKNIEFKHVQNEFQNKLLADIESINNTKEILVDADKSRNIYKINETDYKKLLLENVTKTYKKSNLNKVSRINKEAKKLVSSLNIGDRTEILQESQAYITIKDHKEGFPNKITCRLINPSKSDIGKISKRVLDKINENIINVTKINQWKNTSSVINWFSSLKETSKCSFIVFDIENFYPSISPQLFTKAINFAKQFGDIKEEDMKIIMQARQTLLFHDKEPWVKKTGDEDFDVPMGCFDGAEVCQLVGSYILSKLSSLINQNDIGLYRDDGLGILRNMSGPQIDSKRKQIISLFKECNLNITIQTNVHIVDYLDTQFNLRNMTFRPYRKPNNDPIYINKNSNHPTNVLKQLPKAIGKRISEISSCKDIFDSSIGLYEKALKESGFNEKLVYQEKVIINEEEKDEKKKRKRNIIWFNPPFSMNVKTNIGRIFFKLMNKHFPKNNQLYKIFNKNNVKLSYSCTRNMGKIISAHNNSIVNDKNPTYSCNCRNKAECPLTNKCLTRSVIYKAVVQNEIDEETKFYLGLTENSFKERFNNHKKSFKHKRYEKESELSKYIWELKEQNKSPSISWSIVKKVNSKPINNFCKLCLMEKLYIIKSLDNKNMLNKRSELISKCRHQNKMLLSNYKHDSND